MASLREVEVTAPSDPEQNYPERARASCLHVHSRDAAGTRAASASALPAWVDEEAVARFAASLDIDEVRRFGSTLAQDANATRVEEAFSSVDEEAGFITVMHALDFGGGWRQELHRHHGKGAWLTVKPGIIAMHRRSEGGLTAEWLAQLSDQDVAEMFHLEGAAALVPFVRSLRQVCNEIGQGLAERGHRSPGDFVARCLITHAGTPEPAAALVRELVRAFPHTFDDRHALPSSEHPQPGDTEGDAVAAAPGDGSAGQGGAPVGSGASATPVFFYKKAQLVVGELYHRFRGEDERFAFADGDRLTAFIDNVIVAVLRKLGVVATTPDLASRIEAHQALPSGGLDEVALRSAAMAGVETIVQRVEALRGPGKLTAVELGNYLWGHLGKTPEYRRYNRHATKDTVFY